MKNLSLFILVLISSSRAFAAPSACEDDLLIHTAADAQYCGSMSRSQPQVSSQCDPEVLPDDGSVWRVGSRRWDSDYEKLFADWLVREVSDRVFYETNFATDCADAVFVLRAIFSRIHHLPFVIAPHAYHGKTAFHQGWKNWAQVSTQTDWNETNWKTKARTDLRFRKFIGHMKYYFNTLDIPSNTYPIELFGERELSSHLRVGSVIFWGSHIGTVFQVDTQCRSPIIFRDSHVPADVRPFPEVPSAGELFSQEWNQTDGSGYLNWSWDIVCDGKWQKVRDEDMPGYSREQFSGQYSSIRDWIDENVGRLAPDLNYFEKNLKHLKESFAFRNELVNTAVKLMPTHEAELKNPKSALYEAYSTPSRDKKSCEKLNQLAADTLEPDSKLDTDAWFEMLNQHSVTKFKVGAQSYSISLGDLMMLCTQPKPFSSAPADPLSKRWGLTQLLNLRVQGGAEIINAKRGLRATAQPGADGSLRWVRSQLPVTP